MALSFEVVVREGKGETRHHVAMSREMAPMPAIPGATILSRVNNLTDGFSIRGLSAEDADRTTWRLRTWLGSKISMRNRVNSSAASNVVRMGTRRGPRCQSRFPNAKLR